MDGQVLQCLQATLSAEEATRRHAEEQLRQLFLLPGMLLNAGCPTKRDLPPLFPLGEKELNNRGWTELSQAVAVSRSLDRLASDKLSFSLHDRMLMDTQPESFFKNTSRPTGRTSHKRLRSLKRLSRSVMPSAPVL